MKKNWLVDAWIETSTIDEMSDTLSKAQAFKDLADECNIEPTIDNFIKMLEDACDAREARLLGTCSCGSASLIQVDGRQYICTDCNKPKRILD